jgi:hypothetical protein
MKTAGALNWFIPLVLGTASICTATAITYSVNQTIGVGSATGNIVTDGTIGVLNSADILNWNLLLNDGTNTFNLSGPPTSLSQVTVDGTDLSATASQLLFNFSAGGGLFDLLDIDGGYLPSVCFSAQANCTSFDATGEGIGESVMIFSFPQSTSLSGTDVIATAPEPATFPLIGMAFGLTFLAARRRSVRKAVQFE